MSWISPPQSPVTRKRYAVRSGWCEACVVSRSTRERAICTCLTCLDRWRGTGVRESRQGWARKPRADRPPCPSVPLDRSPEVSRHHLLPASNTLASPTAPAGRHSVNPVRQTEFESSTTCPLIMGRLHAKGPDTEHLGVRALRAGCRQPPSSRARRSPLPSSAPLRLSAWALRNRSATSLSFSRSASWM